MTTIERRFPALAAALLFAWAVLLVSSMLQETQTWDEGIHLAAGYSYWKTGDFRLNPEHPPVFKLLSAVPLLFMDPQFPVDKVSWERSDQAVAGDYFLYKNRVGADALLQWGRAMTVLCSLGLGALLAWWTRRKFGSAAALFALSLLVLDPNITAHGRYVTNDLLLALTAFAATVAWAEYLETGRPRWLFASGLTLGLALVSKFSGAFLVPVFGILWVIRSWQAGEWRWKRLAVAAVVIALIAGVVVSAVYWPATLQSFRSGPPLEQIADRTTGIGHFLYWLSQDTGMPAHPYLAGLNRMSHYAKTHAQYLLGRNSMHGWWYYFPVAFAVKTPTAVLLLVVLGVVAAVASLLRRGVVKRLRAAPFVWHAALAPAAVYSAIVLNSPVNLGIRYLLPVYPLLYLVLAGIVFHPALARFRKAVVLTAAALLIFENARIYPHYLAFFNTVSGGPEAGPRYLADSNIDWGQDIKKLRKYFDRIGWKGPVSGAYFGRAAMWYYGVHGENLPETHQKAEREKLDCLGWISVTQLQDVYAKPGAFAWLRQLQPVAKVGYSIYVYDLRKTKTPIDWRDRGH